jgi:hypothetical protein
MVVRTLDFPAKISVLDGEMHSALEARKTVSTIHEEHMDRRWMSKKTLQL